CTLAPRPCLARHASPTPSSHPPVSGCRSFFFSSRRRHTSWPRDWSSDVCSSDLRSATWATTGRKLPAERAGLPVALLAGNFLPVVAQVAERHPGLRLIVDHLGRLSGTKDEAAFANLPDRSEERRVGRECIYLRTR